MAGSFSAFHIRGTSMNNELGKSGTRALAMVQGRVPAEEGGAVRAAVARLPVKERALLRLHLVDGMSIDALGARYQVSRSTAARWLAAARDALRALTREELEARIGPADLASMAGFVHSHLELSTHGLLGDGSP
jgi:RNA polymerase sigma-70 factor (ECF subfamily)